jgi:hypothetical protein
MKSLWGNLYDRVKDRRYGLLFLLVAVGVSAPFLLVRAGAEARAAFPRQFEAGAAAIGAVVVCGVALRLSRELFPTRRRGGAGNNCSPLSSDELIKARSKLLRKQDRKAQ